MKRLMKLGEISVQASLESSKDKWKKSTPYFDKLESQLMSLFPPL